jgi:hypothetical protein
LFVSIFLFSYSLMFILFLVKIDIKTLIFFLRYTLIELFLKCTIFYLVVCYAIL